MSDNKNKNGGKPFNESVGNDGNRLIHSLQTDSSNYVPPSISKLSVDNASAKTNTNTSNNNSNDKN